MKKLVILMLPLMLVLTSCNLDFFPSDAMTPDQITQDPGGAAYVTDGCYSMMKDEVEYVGYSSGNSYIRHYMQMTEYPSDNICLSGRTTDPLYEATCYKMNSTLKNIATVWWLGYKIIYAANSVIETVQDGASITSDQLKGECYFLRAMCHLHLVTLYAKPYTLGRENAGVVLRTSTNTSVTQRATVGEVYDQIVKDLESAARLMTPGAVRGNKGYASREAAQGLLSRVYLYMEENQKVVDVVTEMLAGAAPSSKLDADFSSFFANALNSKETLLAVAHTALETKGQSSIASMYINDGMGWGEVFSSDPLNTLYERYPQDKRYVGYVKPQYKKNSTKYMISYAVETEGNDSRTNEIKTLTLDTNNDKYYFTEGSSKVYVETEQVNGEYNVYFIMLNGVKTAVRFTQEIQNRQTYPMYYVSKFSYQDGDPMLSSPVLLRWGEVILNRAEAYAKLGKDAEALSDVNAIRERAGLTGDAQFATTKMHGYASTLDVVLDERRLELAFEGHRTIDMYRNKRNLDRRYAGSQPWEIVEYTDNKIQYPIPFDEVTVSGIAQNPGYN